MHHFTLYNTVELYFPTAFECWPLWQGEGEASSCGLNWRGPGLTALMLFPVLIGHWTTFLGRCSFKSSTHLFKIGLAFFFFLLLVLRSLLFWIQVFCWYNREFAKLKGTGSILCKKGLASGTSSGSPRPPSLLTSWLQIWGVPVTLPGSISHQNNS